MQCDSKPYLFFSNNPFCSSLPPSFSDKQVKLCARVLRCLFTNTAWAYSFCHLKATTKYAPSYYVLLYKINAAALRKSRHGDFFYFDNKCRCATATWWLAEVPCCPVTQVRCLTCVSSAPLRGSHLCLLGTACKSYACWEVLAVPSKHKNTKVLIISTG